MLPTRIATVLFLVNIIVVSMLGIGVGYFTCLGLRQGWSRMAAIIDAALALVVAIISAYVISAIDAAHGVLQSRVTLILTIAAGSVFLRHLLRLSARRLP
jgi:hypothetical protein